MQHTSTRNMNGRKGMIFKNLWLTKAESESLEAIRKLGVDIEKVHIETAGDILITAIRRGDMK